MDHCRTGRACWRSARDLTCCVEVCYCKGGGNVSHRERVRVMWLVRLLGRPGTYLVLLSPAICAWLGATTSTASLSFASRVVQTALQVPTAASMRMVVSGLNTHHSSSASVPRRQVAQIFREMKAQPLAVRKGPTVMALGPDGNIWFMERAAQAMGEVAMSGVIQEVHLPALVVCQEASDKWWPCSGGRQATWE